jgi:hypothetical protein
MCEGDRERGVLGDAGGRESHVSPASLTPIPPGTGITLENNDTIVLMRMNVLSGSSNPKAQVTIASVIANKISDRGCRR